MYIQVSNNLVAGGSFALPKKYKLPDGSTTNGLKNFSASELKAIGIYPLIDASVVPEAWQEFVDSTYVVSENEVTVTNNYSSLSLAAYKQRKIAALYEDKNNQLDALVEGYSQLEVATWPAIQADVLQFGVDASVGAAMQVAIDTSGYDAQGLSDLLLPRIQAQATIYAARKTEAGAIMAAVDHASV